jgi:hypothetical protein
MILKTRLQPYTRNPDAGKCYAQRVCARTKDDIIAITLIENLYLWSVEGAAAVCLNDTPTTSTIYPPFVFFCPYLNLYDRVYLVSS